MSFLSFLNRQCIQKIINLIIEEVSPSYNYQSHVLYLDAIPFLLSESSLFFFFASMFLLMITNFTFPLDLFQHSDVFYIFRNQQVKRQSQQNESIALLDTSTLPATITFHNLTIQNFLKKLSVHTLLFLLFNSTHLWLWSLLLY